MKKLFRKKIRKIFSILALFSLFFQNIFPIAVFAISSDFSRNSVKPSIIEIEPKQVSLGFNHEENTFSLAIISDTDRQYLLTYEDLSSTHDSTLSATKAIQGLAVSKKGEAKADFYGGTCSDGDCVADLIEQGDLVLPGTNYQASFEISKDQSWLRNENLATTTNLVVGREYIAPQNDQVSLIFTKLPDNPGKLFIEEVELSEEQVKALGAYSKVAYDISSDMENGTFEYDLKLPMPEGVDQKQAQVIYAESVQNLSVEKVEVVDEQKVDLTGDEVKIEGLDHFTVFVVAVGVTNGSNCTVASISGVCYDNLQSAVDAAVDGDEIELASDITLGQRVDINKTLTLDGNGNTIYASFPKTSNSNNAALGIFGDDVVIKDVVIDGVGGMAWPNQLHGINTYKANNVYIDNVTTKNFGGSGIVVNGSSVIVNNITTSGNSWHGINVAQGSGVSEPSVLTVNGHSVHQDLAHIYMDDTTQSVILNDTLGQYDISNPQVLGRINDRLYTHKDIIPPSKPVNLGFNSKVASFSNRPVEIQCGGSTNINSISHHWEAIDDAVRYERQWVYPGRDPMVEANWQGAEQWTTPYSNYRTFGGGSGVQGLWHVRVRAQDAAGNWSAYSDPCAIRFDSVKPVAPTIIFPTEGQWFNSQPILNDWTDVSDDSGIKNYRIEYQYDDGHSFSGGPYRESIVSQRNHVPGDSEQGGVKFRVQAIDNAGNEGDWSDWRHYYYDKLAPSTPTIIGFLNPNLSCDSITNSKNITVDWTDSTDNVLLAGYDYNIDYPLPNGNRGIWNAFFPNSQYTGSLNEGTHFIKVRAKDGSGLVSDWSNTCSITADWTAPVTSLTSPAPGHTNQPILISGVSTDQNKVDSVSLFFSISGENNWQLITTLTNNGDSEPFSFSHSWIPNSEGTYDIKVSGVDKVGNVENSAYVYGVIYDVSPPESPAWITSPFITRLADVNRPGDNQGGNIKFSASSSPDVARYQYQYVRTHLNGSHSGSSTNVSILPSACTAGVCNWNNVTLEKNQIWVYRLRAIDHAGNTSDWTNWNDLTDSQFINLRHQSISYQDFINRTGAFSSANGFDTSKNNGFTIREEVLPFSSITAPDSSGGPIVTNSSVLNIQYSASDADTAVDKVRLYSSTNGGSTFNEVAVSSTGSFAYEFPTEGEYCFYTQAEDIANMGFLDLGLGNQESAKSCQLSVVYDSTPPEAPTSLHRVLADGSEISCNSWIPRQALTPTWTASTSDDVAYYEYSSFNLNGVPGIVQRNIGLTTSFNTGGWVAPTDGVGYKYALRSVDQAGNKSDWVECAINYDSIAPSSTISTFSLENGGEVETNDFNGLIEGTASDPTPSSGLSRVELEISYDSFLEGSATQYWDGSEWQDVAPTTRISATGTNSWSYQIPSELVFEGIYNVTSHAVDNAGNIETTYTIRIVYDKTIPEVDLTINPTNPDGDNGWYRTLPQITLTASDNYKMSKIEFQWNSTSSAGWQTYASPISPPSQGQNILYYRGVDVVGNSGTRNSEFGVKEVKFDNTAPVDGPLNVRVENIGSTTAWGRWNKPENSSDITRYVLSWKHEKTGDSKGTTVGKDDFEKELTQLYDGEWLFTVKAMDDAGNFKQGTAKFTVGGGGSSSSSSDEQVLGVDSEVSTLSGLGQTGLVAGALAIAPESLTNDEESEVEESENEAQDSGSVLGESIQACSGWKQWLPIILLVIQALSIIIFELINRNKNTNKLVFLFASTAVSIGLFLLLRDGACSTGESLLSILSRWYVVVSLALSALIKVIFYAFIEEV